jgi:hypothetical protein
VLQAETSEPLTGAQIARGRAEEMGRSGAPDEAICSTGCCAGSARRFSAARFLLSEYRMRSSRDLARGIFCGCLWIAFAAGSAYAQALEANDDSYGVPRVW